MADEHQPQPPDEPPAAPRAGQWGPPPSAPPPAPSPGESRPGPDGEPPAAAGAPAAGGWTAVSPAPARRRPVPGAVLAAIGLLLAGAFSVAAALIDMVQADETFAGGIDIDLDFLERVAIGMNRLDARLIFLLPLALLLVRPALERPPAAEPEDRAIRWVLAGSAFLAGAFLFLVSLRLIAALADNRFAFASTGAALLDSLAGLAVAGAAGAWAWRELQRMSERPSAPPSAAANPPAAPQGAPAASSPWSPAPPVGHPDPTPPVPPPGAADAPAEPGEQERRWGPPPI